MGSAADNRFNIMEGNEQMKTETENIMQDSINKVAKMMEADMERTLKPQIIEKLIANELEDANKKFPAFASAHEGWAVLLEEATEASQDMEEVATRVSEMFGTVMRHKTPGIGSHDPIDQRMGEMLESCKRIRHYAVRGINELIQVAAMCDKFNAMGEPADPVEGFYKKWAKEKEEEGDRFLEMLKTPIKGDGKPITLRKYDPIPGVPQNYETAIALEKSDGPESIDRRCDNCKSYYLTPVHGNPICLNQKNQKAETKPSWKCPEWEARTAGEDLEAFNKNNLSQKLKNRCRDCAKFVGDIFCATHNHRVDADWTCAEWEGKEGVKE